MSIATTAKYTPSMERFDSGYRVEAETVACSGRQLADCEIFMDLEGSDLESLMARAETRRIEAGETVFRRGDPGDSVLFIRSGSVVVEADCTDRGSVPVSVIKSGEIFGEIAVIEGATRSATVTAREPCDLLVMPQAEFLALLVKHPGMGIRMLGAAAARLRHVTDLVGEIDARSYSGLCLG